MILVLGKAKSHRVPNLDCSGAELPKRLDVSAKNSAVDMIHKQACCYHKAAHHQLFIGEAF